MIAENLKRVFICSPYQPEVDPVLLEYEKELSKNIELAKEACKLVYQEGYLPMAPHLYFPQFLDDRNPVHRNEGLMIGLLWLKKCSEVWVFGDHISSGMAKEIAKAHELGIPIKIKQIKEEWSADEQTS